MLRQFQKQIEELRRQLEEGGCPLSGSGENIGIEDGGEKHADLDNGNKRKSKRGHSGINKQKMLEIQQMIEADKRKLEEQKDMAVEERNRIQAHVEQKELELKRAKETQANLLRRMEAIQSRIIVGGENLLEKAEFQEKLLEQSAAELQRQQQRAEQLHQKLREKEEERINIEEKYNTLQEESADKRRKLRKLGTLYLQAKAELEDVRSEHAREMEALLENIRQVGRELSLHNLLIDHFIPKPYQELIEKNVQWNEDFGEWQLRCVAYTGNNMRRPEPERVESPIDLSQVYLTYHGDETTESRLFHEPAHREC